MSEEISPYTERAHLLSLLTTQFAACRWYDENAEPGYRNVIAIILPIKDEEERWGAWHIHERDMPLFMNITEALPTTYDGHTTEQKYWAIGRYVRQWNRLR